MGVLADSDEQTSAGRSDHRLVAAARGGDERAFGALYDRYRVRIHRYVLGMVRDDGRAEDITQEVFVSALRRIRATERPIAFKPWIFEIAKNACIDAYRRRRNADEIPLSADDRLSPADRGRLVSPAQTPAAAFDTKEDFDRLCGALGGISDTHHRILLLRELEGMSYKAISERMGISTGAVESTLFRARKRLAEEYDALASGARCIKVATIISGSAGARFGMRDRRVLARHISHCQPCRREALLAGVEVTVPLRSRVADKLVALLPLPWLARLRGGGDAHANVTAVASSSGASHSWMVQLPALVDPIQLGSKAAAGIAAVVIAGGAGGAAIVTERDADKGPRAQRVVAGPTESSPRSPRVAPAAQMTASGAAGAATGSATSKSSAARARGGRITAERPIAGGAGGREMTGDRRLTDSPAARTPAAVPETVPSARSDAAPPAIPEEQAPTPAPQRESEQKPGPPAPLSETKPEARTPPPVESIDRPTPAKPRPPRVDPSPETGRPSVPNPRPSAVPHSATPAAVDELQSTTETALRDTQKTIQGGPQNLVGNATNAVKNAVDGTAKLLEGVLGPRTTR